MILVTGGAGFIGSHLVDLLIKEGFKVRVVDNFHPQVHPEKPSYLNPDAEYVEGDVRDKRLMENVLEGVEVIFHFASRVGVGQSMYEIEDYVDANLRGTGVLLDLLANTPHKVKKLIVASSMSIYGEGAYRCKNCGVVYPERRNEEDLEKGVWEVRCPGCGEFLTPIPTPENKPLYSSSIYAQTKKYQEEMCLLIGKTYGIPVVSLRFFNVFGSRQSLSNPYTGVVAIFLSRILSGNPPVIFEDGNQTRDFIHVKDVVYACYLALMKEEANYEIINLGRGEGVKIKDISSILQTLVKREVGEEITGRYRKGDVRHCFADITKLKEKLGFTPKITLEEGMEELLPWMEKEKVRDYFAHALKEMEERGLVK